MTGLRLWHCFLNCLGASSWNARDELRSDLSLSPHLSTTTDPIHVHKCDRRSGLVSFCAETPRLADLKSSRPAFPLHLGVSLRSTADLPIRQSAPYLPTGSFLLLTIALHGLTPEASALHLFFTYRAPYLFPSCPGLIRSPIRCWHLVLSFLFPGGPDWLGFTWRAPKVLTY